MMWSGSEAIAFARLLETGLSPHYHVALGGSCLFSGSDHDLDLLVYPHDSSAGDRDQQLIVVALVLQELGLRRTREVAQIHKYWRKHGSNDEKQVEVWYLGDRRVDIIHVR